MLIWSFVLIRAEQYQRNGNTRFVLIGRAQRALGEPQAEAQRFVVPAEDCSEDVCQMLVQAQPNDILNIGFDEQDDCGNIIRRFQSACIHRPFQAGNGSFLVRT